MTAIFVDGINYQDSMRRMLCYEEGARNAPYFDTAGNLTIGVGRNLDSKPISEAVIRLMLDEDIEEAVRGARDVLGASFYEQALSPVRQLAIVNLVFNIGEAGFRQFEKCIYYLHQKSWEEAANEIWPKSLYAGQVPKRAERISHMISREVYPYADSRD